MISCREAGPNDAHTLLLLHGLQTSSRQFEALFPRLADQYHLVAPDYPGFGYSGWPDPKKFASTFDHIAETMNRFTKAQGANWKTRRNSGKIAQICFRWQPREPAMSESIQR